MAFRRLAAARLACTCRNKSPLWINRERREEAVRLGWYRFGHSSWLRADEFGHATEHRPCPVSWANPAMRAIAGGRVASEDRTTPAYLDRFVQDGIAKRVVLIKASGISID
jgi:hypothetical protein